MDQIEFKQVLKDMFDDLPDVRVTTRKLFDTKVRVDFPTHEAAKLFKNKHVPLRPKYKDSPIYINWILTKEVATDSFLARVAKRFLAEKLGDHAGIKTCSFTPHTVFVNKKEACVAQKGALHKCTTWPNNVTWADLVAHADAQLSRVARLLAGGLLGFYMTGLPAALLFHR